MDTFENSRKIVGYIRTFIKSDMACNTQKYLIMEYCRRNKIECEDYFCDNTMATWQSKKKSTCKLAIPNDIQKNTYKAWIEMFEQVKLGQISCILVDSVIRLYNGELQKKMCEDLCTRYNVTIIEVGVEPIPNNSIEKSIVVYHSANNPTLRTCVTCNDIDRLYEFAICHCGQMANSLYLDLDIKNKTQLERMLSSGCGHAILVKSFFHMKRHMIPFLTMARRLYENDIGMISMEEGKLIFFDTKEKSWFSEPMKAAIYDCHRSDYESETRDMQMAKFKLFMEYKAVNWELEEVYIDDYHSKQRNKLENLLEKVDHYDIVLIDTFGKLGEDIQFLSRIMKKISTPIYSLKEGGIGFEGTEDI